MAKVKRFIWKTAKKTSKTMITFSKFYQFSSKFIQREFIGVQTRWLMGIFEFLIFLLFFRGSKCHFLTFFEKRAIFWPKMAPKIKKTKKFKNRLQSSCRYHYEVVWYKFLVKLKLIWKSYHLFRLFFYGFSKSWSKHCIFGYRLRRRPTRKWP